MERTEQHPTETVEFVVPGMGSDHCAGIIRHTLGRHSGIQDIQTHIATHKVRITFEQTTISVDSLRQAIENAGYDVVGQSSEEHDREALSEDGENRHLAMTYRNMWIALVPATLIMVLMAPHMFWQPVPGYLAIISLLAFPVVFLHGGAQTHRSAWRSLKNRTANMDVLISLGSLPPYFLGLLGFFTPMTSFTEMAATIMAFHLIGRYLEAKAKGRASMAIRRLLTMGAKHAWVERPEGEVQIPVAQLVPGDIIIVRPGEKVASDGEIVDGQSHVDESLATGESLPVYRATGDPVIGATINKEGRLRVRVTRIGKESFLSQVIQLVEQAQSSRIPVQEFADRMTGRFVPLVVLVSLASLTTWLLAGEALRPILYWGAEFLPWVNPEASTVVVALLAAIAVLVIACPCALGLATPTALMVGAGVGAENGILIRSGEAIQTFREVKTVLLDKTGTITEGKPHITKIHPLENTDEATILLLAASVEHASEHPLAKAIVEAARERDMNPLEVTDFQSVTGAGVKGTVEGKAILVGNQRIFAHQEIQIGEEATRVQAELETDGNTVMGLAVDGKVVGLIALRDTIKERSAMAIRAMKQNGLRVVMVTGDNKAAARAIAREVGIDEVQAGVLPEGKVDAVRMWQQRTGTRVAMVGDGINDAPALKQADVGIALGAGADVAIEAADVTLIRNDLTGVVEAMHLSKATFRKVVENLIWASSYNAAAIPIAAAGLLHPMIGVIAMVASSLSVIGNSLLLRRTARNFPRWQS
ncbi:heavy metal translocating P-type ATPase [Desulfurispirillum indicum]|uniref:heavy metal translocating P-type ATPase n=1 Tax=Desulfurispirillum indicum TaxID=936456 RepID=UPI001CFBA58D|nr:heavy metal translocating P-type ATPase [Desulfurispirillum indicum]UCZ56732.1 heavy metal translocating P-type ATPase [Desulfurispirillum indicum]